MIAALSMLFLSPLAAGADDDASAGAAAPDYKAMRIELIRTIARHVRETRKETGIDAIDPRVLEAMAAVPRHEFVPEPLKPFAYIDIPLPVGHGQNISQPFLIALMTHLAQVDKDDIVFETGTGAGYQAAILSRLAKRVYSVEVVEPLAKAAAARLRRLGYDNVEVRHADGYYGWRAHAPYDAILVKEAVHHIPPPLLNQLRPGGRMIVPVGPLDGVQMLTLVEKDETGRLREKPLIEVKFTPLQGGERI